MRLIEKRIMSKIRDMEYVARISPSDIVYNSKDYTCYQYCSSKIFLIDRIHRIITLYSWKTLTAQSRLNAFRGYIEENRGLYQNYRIDTVECEIDNKPLAKVWR